MERKNETFPSMKRRSTGRYLKTEQKAWQVATTFNRLIIEIYFESKDEKNNRVVTSYTFSRFCIESTLLFFRVLIPARLKGIVDNV